MENVSNNKSLCLNNEIDIARKKEAILSYLEKGVDVLAIFDTETTGLNIYPKPKAGIFRDRILEVGFIMYYIDGADDEMKPILLDNKPVTFQEYVNPFRESKKQQERSMSVYDSNPEALEIHHITKNFLNGKESFNGIKLHKAAPTFAEIKPFMEEFLCLEELIDVKGTMHFVAHNGKKFDAAILTEEMNLIDQYNPAIKNKKTFESIVPNIIDTKIIMKELYDREDLLNVENQRPSKLKIGNTMSYLAHVLEVEETGRENFHGALLDSVILKNVFNALLKEPVWKNSRNKIEFNTLNTINTVTETIALPSLNNNPKQSNDKADILTIIKTDASLNEGTGTVKKYIEAAKKAGLKNLVMADVVDVSRFVSFYESCREADIKPIIGTTFKIESEYDIYHHINKNKASGVTDTMFDVISQVLKEVTNKEYESIEHLIKEENVSLDNLMKTGVVIQELNKKRHSTKRVEATMNTLLKKTATAILRMVDIKYNKDVTVNFDLLETNVLKHTTMIKYKPFDRATDHGDLLIVADNDEGFLEIKKLITDANINGQHWVKPKKTLGKGEQPVLKINAIGNVDNITAIVGSKKDVLGRLVKLNDLNTAKLITQDLKRVFGSKLKGQINTTEQNIDMVKENQFLQNIHNICSNENIDLFAVQQAVVANKSDFRAHINKYAMLTAAKIEDISISDITLDTGNTNEEYIKSSEILNEIFSLNTDLMSNVESFVSDNILKPVLHKPSLPTFQTGNSNTQAEELYERGIKGLKEKLGKAFMRQVKKGKIEKTKENYIDFCKEYKKRFDYEYKIITDMDFPGYFLIKEEIVKFCKKEGITVGAGRGSAAGSLVVYSLGITDVDPIEHDLIFERFLNPERIEMPDIDTDIVGSGRIKVLNHLVKLFEKEGLGYSGAAYIMTKGTYATKSTLSDVSKASNMSKYWIEEFIGLIPDSTLSIEENLETNEMFAYRYETEAKTHQIVDFAIQLENLQKSTGKHPGGVVVGALIEQAPITYVDGIPVVQADKDDIEALGAVKFDVLVVETLPKLQLALENIERDFGIEKLEKIGIVRDGALFNFDSFEYTDEETFKMLREGNSTSVFQIDSPLFQQLLKKIKVETFEEIVAINALGRPGPLQSKMDETYANNKFNPELRESVHPLVDDLLDETYGTIIYQEQIMAIAKKMAGFTMGQAENLRKAMGKKKPEIMAQQKEAFLAGAKNNGVEEDVAEGVFDTIEKFSGYGFNKSHSVSYALLTFKMAYLRKHFPTQTMAAIMTLDSHGAKSSEKIGNDISSAKLVDVKVKNPDVNLSANDFIPQEDNLILYGLEGIKGSSYDVLLSEREKNGAFSNLENIVSRVAPSKGILSLIHTGALDSIELAAELTMKEKLYIDSLTQEESKILKRQLLNAEYQIFEPLLKTVDKRKSYTEGNFNKLDIRENYKKTFNDFSKNKSSVVLEVLEIEKDLLAGFLTSHPLDIGDTKERIKNNTKYPQIELNHLELDTVKQEGNLYNISGCVTELKPRLMSANQKEFAIIKLTSDTSSAPIFLGVDGYEKMDNALKEVNKVGLREGDILSFDISFYTNKESQVRASIDSVYFADEKFKFSLKDDKKNKVENYLKNKQQTKTSKNQYN
jgi:DNA polymerase-3 subunit alpha